MQIIGGGAITSATLAAFLRNLLLNHTPGRRKPGPEAEPDPVKGVVPDAAPAV